MEFQDFENVGKDIELLKAKGLSMDLRILGQYSGIDVLGIALVKLWKQGLYEYDVVKSTL